MNTNDHNPAQNSTENANQEHQEKLNRDLDSFVVKLIKPVGIVGIIIGLAILIAFWVWVIHWLYKIW
jgi:hypothetical protein